VTALGSAPTSYVCDCRSRTSTIQPTLAAITTPPSPYVVTTINITISEEGTTSSINGTTIGLLSSSLRAACMRVTTTDSVCSPPGCVCLRAVCELRCCSPTLEASSLLILLHLPWLLLLLLMMMMMCMLLMCILLLLLMMYILLLLFVLLLLRMLLMYILLLLFVLLLLGGEWLLEL
jgi:hypothetical protein